MSSKTILLALLAWAVVIMAGSGLDVMEVDAAQYAAMSRDMLASDDWLQLYHRGHDYLDKPPLLFWLSAVSFKLFGVHNWSYKLPSILFAFLGVFATYRFAVLHYAREVAATAALMFAGSAAFLVMTNDVRCDTILTGSVITAIWLGSAWMEQRRVWQLIGCALAIAAGLLAKGPIGIVAPMLALGSEVVFKKRWKVLRDPYLLLVLAVIACSLAPMCMGLYQQHGAHGLRFYFWEQSFGRITGENRWKDDSSIFFFTHEVLWQLLPWTLFVLLGLWRSIKGIALRRPLPEYASIGGVVLAFIALSLSQFKLPHYLYVIVPLFAVIAAQAWHAVEQRWVRVAHYTVLALLVTVTIALVVWSFPQGGTIYLIGFAVVFVVHIRSKQPPGMRMFWSTWGLWTVVGLAINGHVYPQLLQYQGNAQAGKWAATHHVDRDHFFGLQVAGTALDFYAGYPVRWLSDPGETRPMIAPGVVLYTDKPHYMRLVEAGLIPDTVITIPNYEVQLLGIDFLMPARRDSVVEQHFLLRY